jgi:hypothetical protein
MRIALSCLLLIAATRLAAAEQRTCYAGTETREAFGRTAKLPLVVVLEVDPDASKIRVRNWNSETHDVDNALVFNVDAKAKTITADDGSGTLKGNAWKWTGYRAKVSNPVVTYVVESKFDAKSFKATSNAQFDKVPAIMRWDATAFDCKELDNRKRALSTTTRGCYVGTASMTTSAEIQPVVIVQVFDKARIELRFRFVNTTTDRVHVIAIDGDKAKVDSDAVKLIGKPGAWTGYTWLHDEQGRKDTIKGTLGGERVTHVIAMKSSTGSKTLTLDARKFDCADLLEKQAALR